MIRATLFGTRGSLPVPGPATARYGGNTSTVELRGDDGSLLVLDAGTGLLRLAARLPAGTRRIDLLLTHLHMDHIQGLGFFRPLYDPEIEVRLWGPAGGALPLDVRLSRYLSPPLFPVHLRDLPRVACHELPREPFAIGPFRVRADFVCHPNPTVGYRVEADGASLVYLPDHEPALGFGPGGWLEPEWTSGHALAEGADLLLHDAQYDDAEYAQRVGWGHSTYRHAFEFAARVGARELVPFHHDPSHDDRALDRLLEDAVRRFRPAFKVSPGREGAVFRLGAGRRRR